MSRRQARMRTTCPNQAPSIRSGRIVVLAACRNLVGARGFKPRRASPPASEAGPLSDYGTMPRFKLMWSERHDSNVQGVAAPVSKTGLLPFTELRSDINFVAVAPTTEHALTPARRVCKF